MQDREIIRMLEREGLVIRAIDEKGEIYWFNADLLDQQVYIDRFHGVIAY